MNMKASRIINIIMFTFYFVTGVIIIFGMADYLRKNNQSQSYFTGTYAKYCYEEGTKNTNIKQKIYFDSLYQCGKPLN